MVKSFLAPGTVNINVVGLTINTTPEHESCRSDTEFRVQWGNAREPRASYRFLSLR